MHGFADMHAHVLFGLDDGPNTVQDSIALLRAAYADGIRILVATPHVHSINHADYAEKYRAAFSAAQNAARQIAPDFRLLPGNELLAFSGCGDAIRSGHVLTLGGTALVLTEFPVQIDLQAMTARLSEIQYAGYQPVLAHAERYSCLADNKLKCLSEMKKRGILLQINAQTVISPGFFYKNTLKKMFVSGLIDFVATDAHSVAHRPPRMKKAYQILKTWCGEQAARDLCGDRFLRFF